MHGSGNHSSSKGVSMNPNPTYRRENSHGKNNGSASDNSDDESRARLFEDKKWLQSFLEKPQDLYILKLYNWSKPG